MITRRDALKRVAVAGAIAGVVGAVGGGAFVWLNREQDKTDNSEPREQSEVGVGGFDIALGSVHVSAPAGVASTGTKVLISPVSEGLPKELINFATSVGQPVRVVLGDGQQPEKPVTIKFDVSGGQLPLENSEESVLMVLSYSESEDLYFLMEAKWDSDKEEVIVESDHLSDFWPIKIELPAMFEDIVAKLTLNYSYSKPECAYLPLTTPERTFSIEQVGDDSVWPCIQENDGHILLDLHSNSILPWAVKTVPAATGSVTGDFGDLGPALAKIYSGFFDVMGDTRTAILPSNVASFKFAIDEPPSSVHLKVEPGLFLATTLVWAIQSSLDILLKGKVPDDLIDGAGALDCIVSVINTAQEVTDEREYLGIIDTMLGCIKESIVVEGRNWVEKAVAETALAIVSLFAGGAGLVATAFVGSMKTITSTDRIDFAFTETSVEPNNTNQESVIEQVPTVPADDGDGSIPNTTESSTGSRIRKGYGPDGDIYVIVGESLEPGSQVLLDIESSDGYRARLLVSVGPEFGYRGVVPPRCSVTFLETSPSDFYFTSRSVEFFLESVQVDGFDWPSTRAVKVYHKGYVPCGPTPDSKAGYWEKEIVLGSVNRLELATGSTMSPAHPDGIFNEPRVLELIVEDVTPASCELVSKDSGLKAQFGDDFSDGFSFTSVSGCRLQTIDNTTYEVDSTETGGFTPVIGNPVPTPTPFP